MPHSRPGAPRTDCARGHRRRIHVGGFTQAQAARQLDIDAKRINRWKKQMEQHGTPERAFPGQGHEHAAELARFRFENAKLHMEREITEKVAVIAK